MTLDKLRTSVAFLDEASGFRPDMVIMDGTPRFEHSEDWEIEGIVTLARDWNAEIWTSATLHREGQTLDERGVPPQVARFDRHLSVVLSLVPQSDHVKVRIIKEHANTAPADVSLELDPRSLMLRWC